MDQCYLINIHEFSTGTGESMLDANAKVNYRSTFLAARLNNL